MHPLVGGRQCGRVLTGFFDEDTSVAEVDAVEVFDPRGKVPE